MSVVKKPREEVCLPLGNLLNVQLDVTVWRVVDEICKAAAKRRVLRLIRNFLTAHAKISIERYKERIFPSICSISESEDR